jgi:hypothetical protein
MAQEPFILSHIPLLMHLPLELNTWIYSFIPIWRQRDGMHGAIETVRLPAVTKYSVRLVDRIVLHERK